MNVTEKEERGEVEDVLVASSIYKSSKYRSLSPYYSARFKAKVLDIHYTLTMKEKMSAWKVHGRF